MSHSSLPLSLISCPLLPIILAFFPFSSFLFTLLKDALGLLHEPEVKEIVLLVWM